MVSAKGVKDSNLSHNLRLSDPHAELPIKNHKYVRNCTELYLAKRGIEQLANFESFVNLEVLWINDNLITKLDGLDKCFRIKQLFAQDNRIHSLEGSSLTHFKFLTELRLYGNKLHDLETTLRILSRLQRLQDLDLFGNPLEEEENYRFYVIATVPSLLVLDRHVITDEERIKAARLPPYHSLVSSSSKRNHARNSRHTTVAGAPPLTMSGTVKILFKEVEAIKREREAKSKARIENQLVSISNAEKSLQQVTVSRTESVSRAPCGRIGQLDEWELAALEKRFNAIEGNDRGSGIPSSQIPVLLKHLTHRGFYVYNNNDDHHSDDSDDDDNRWLSIANALFPNTSRKILWSDFKKCLLAQTLTCKMMSPTTLRRRANHLFSRANTVQLRLQASTSASEEIRAKLVCELHDLTQRAHRLQTLADKSTPSHVATNCTTGQTTSDKPKTHYSVTSYLRDKTMTPVFNELKEQSKLVHPDLASTYKFQSKKFNKYLLNEAPPSTKLVRFQFTL